MIRAQEKNNLGFYLKQGSFLAGDKKAISIPMLGKDQTIQGLDEITYSELRQKIAAYQQILTDYAVKPGSQVLIVLGVSCDFYALVVALLSLGVRLILVDLNMGLRKINQLFKTTPIDIVIGKQPWLSLLQGVTPALWRARKLSLQKLTKMTPTATHGHWRVHPCEQQAPALVTYTSGTTGMPKGADRNHQILIAQHRGLQQQFPPTTDEVSMTCFPVLVLHNLCCGITSILPAVDLKKPGSVQPQRIFQQLIEQQVTHLSAAPAFLRKLCAAQVVVSPSLRGVAVGGAPVSPQLCQQLRECFQQAQITVVYGSTEAEPIAHISGREVEQTRGDGYLVGKIAPFVRLAIANLPEYPQQFNTEQACSDSDIGEIFVQGEHVLKAYIGDADANKKTKIADEHGGIWHRTGDLGYLDQEQRLWLVGRSTSRIFWNEHIIYPFVIECDLSHIRQINLCALLLHNQSLVLWVMLQHPCRWSELTPIIQARLHSRGLDNVIIREIASMPVDRRHNSKVDRITLKKAMA